MWKGLHLVEYVEPYKEIKTITDLVVLKPDAANHNCLVPDRRHRTDVVGEFATCATELGDQDQIVILGVHLLHTLTDFDAPMRFKHAEIVLNIPGNQLNARIPAEDGLLYQPNMMNLGISLLPYIGLESHILQARSTCVTPHGIDREFVAFKSSDAFIVFLLHNKNHFDLLHADDIKTSADGHIYFVRSPLVQRVQKFFTNVVFPHIKYTSAAEARKGLCFGWQSDAVFAARSDMVCAFQIQMEYIHLSPRTPAYSINKRHI